MKRWYFQINYLSPKANSALLAGRCIHTLHGFMMKQDIRHIGVTFPVWSNNSIGNSIGFISQEINSLMQLKKRKYFQDMQRIGMFDISSLALVSNEDQCVQFIRNQRLAKKTEKARQTQLRRLIKRAKTRGEEYTPTYFQPPTQVELNYHTIPISSSKNRDQEYLMCIQKIELDKSLTQTNSLFSSYGLSNSLQPGTVPAYL